MANSKINKGATTDRLVRNTNKDVALKGKLSAPIRTKKTFETHKLKLNSIPVSIVSSLSTGLGTKLQKGQLVRAHNRQGNVSRQSKRTPEEEFVDNNFETFKRDIISRCDRLESGNGTRPVSVAISVRETVEICSNGESENIIDFNKEQWISMTDQEKNMWIKRYLYKIKREILVVYRMILDYRGGDVLEDELSELSSLSSMVDIKHNENLKSTTVQNDYLTAMVQLKELQERHKEMLTTLEDLKNDNAAMSARINVEKTDQEIQTEGVRVEIVERDLDNARDQLSSMCSKLEITDDLVESLRRELREKITELEEKIRELAETKSDVTNLCGQIERLNKTVDEAKADVGNRQKRIEGLCEEKNKLKAEFAEANKERNVATEELIVLKNNSAKMLRELKDLRTKVNEKRSEYVVDSMRLSSQIDEINEKNNQIKKMEAVISKHEDLINNLTSDSIEQNQKIISLEARKISLQEQLKSWENRAGCWINTFVRDEFEAKIDKQKKEIENLTLLTNRLRSAYKNSVSEINGLEDNHKKIVQTKQQIIDKQNRVIALVKGISPYQSKEFVQHKVQDTLSQIFVKYEEDKALAEKLEESLIENSRLQRLVDEYKLRLNSGEARLM